MATQAISEKQLGVILEDYKIHLTGAEERRDIKTINGSANPPSWPTERHRIPPYRPLNRNLNSGERPLGSNAVETAFLFMMFSGVSINAVCATSVTK